MKQIDNLINEALNEALNEATTNKDLEKAYGKFLRVFTKFMAANDDNKKVDALREKLTGEVWTAIRGVTK